MLSEEERENQDRELARKVARDPRLGNTARLIFMMLAAVDSGLTRAALVRLISKSADTIDRGLAELTEAGFTITDAGAYKVNHAGLGTVAPDAATEGGSLLEAAASRLLPDRNLGPAAKLIGMELADGLDKAPGAPPPSPQALAERLGMAEADIVAGLVELTRRGYLRDTGAGPVLDPAALRA